jgi:hypothetical protein
MEIQNTRLLKFVLGCSRSAAGATSGFRRSPSGGGSLSFELALHLCNSAHHGEKTPTCGRGGIQVFPQRHECDASLFELFNTLLSGKAGGVYAAKGIS